MNRLGLLEPSSLSEEQQGLYNEIDQYTGSKYGTKFITKLNDGRFVGPFGVQLHTPEVGHHFLGFAKALAKIPGLTPQGREVAILVVGAHTQAAYETYAHARLSGLSQEDLNMIENGNCPSHFDAEGKVVFKMANALFNRGPLDRGIWEEAVSVLGVSGATAVVQYVGFYRYIANILNGFDVQVPEEIS